VVLVALAKMVLTMQLPRMVMVPLIALKVAIRKLVKARKVLAV